MNFLSRMSESAGFLQENAKKMMAYEQTEAEEEEVRERKRIQAQKERLNEQLDKELAEFAQKSDSDEDGSVILQGVRPGTPTAKKPAPA